MAWTEADKEKMDAAAVMAEQELDTIMEEFGAEASIGNTAKLNAANTLVQWFNRNYMTAGYKRLGRILVAEAKAIRVER